MLAKDTGFKPGLSQGLQTSALSLDRGTLLVGAGFAWFVFFVSSCKTGRSKIICLCMNE